MIPVLSREQVRAVDAHAVSACCVPSIVLMENAGRGAADLVAARLERRGGSVVVVCGGGNNGGDGYVVARQLRGRGAPVRVFAAVLQPKLTGDALVNHDAWVGVGGAVEPLAEAALEPFVAALARATVVVDALLGTGLAREVTGLFRAIIEHVNAAPVYRIALDVPSGLDADTGQPHGASVTAHETVTFAAQKLGLVTSRGAAHAGKVTVCDIGVPADAFACMGASARILQETDVASWLRRRSVAAHKGSGGRLVAVAGAEGKTGAALLVARGALRAGAGTATIATFSAAADTLDHRVLEEMTARIDADDLEPSLDRALKGADVVVVGPGLGLDARARSVVDHVVLRHAGTVVVDADALTHFAGRLGELAGAKGTLVLTPHPGEMARLLGVQSSDVEGDRFAAVRRAADESGAVVLLKGARTLIAKRNEMPVVNPSGNPALATAGSGDVLGGIVGALVVATGDAFHAACAGAFVHGLAAEAWAADTGRDRGLLAHEIADLVPGVLAGLTRDRFALPL
jgi:NAD(P)H-hydrate epimerase